MADIIKLVASDGSGHFYTTTKNKKKHPNKIKRMKYNPVARKHMLYEEGGKLK